MKERINLVIIIAALLAFLYIFQKYFSTMWAVILLASLMVLYGIYMQIAYKHRKRKKRKNPTPLNYDFKPLVSIMIPAHNEAVVIENTVENLLKLDYENFEIIVIDDRSEDNTAQKVMELAQKYEKVHAIVRPKDAFPGKSAVLNEALEIAKGEAILVFDADAKVEQNFLTQLVPYLEPSDVGAVQARKVIMNADTNFLTRCQNNEYAFRYLGEKLRSNRELLLMAVKQNGELLHYASKELKNDKIVVLEAIKNRANALYYASDEIKANKEIVMIAVSKDVHALRYASKELRNDKAYLNKFDNEYIPLVSNCIATLINRNDDDFFSYLSQLSRLQLELLPHTIPEETRDFFLKNIKEDGFQVKLCGAGGGGYLLGFCKNVDKINNFWNNFGSKIVLVK